MAEEQQTKSGTAKVLAENMWFPALFFFGFLVCYMLPFHAPEPHHVKVAVSSPVAAAQIQAGLEEKVPGAYDITAVNTQKEARQKVLDREADAAYAVGGGGKEATLYVAKGNGAILQQMVSQTFEPLAKQQGADLKTVDLAPTSPGDVMGTSTFYLAMAWNIAPYISVMMLMRAFSLSRKAKLITIAVAGALMSVIGYFVANALDIVPDEPLTMLYGFMLTQGIAWTVFGLMPFVRQFIAGVAVSLFVLLSIPSSGGAIPWQLVPGFFRFLHPVMPLGNLIDALHGIYYFDGRGMLRPTLMLLAWMLVGALLITAGALLQRKKQKEAEESSGEASEAVEPEEEIREDPSFETPRPHAVTAGGRAVEDRTPMLQGLVTDPSGGPVTGAIVTITDRRGNQLMHTRTDHEGRYAVTGLPEEFVNVLLTAPDRLPAVARILPESGRPQRQDFVLTGKHRPREDAGSS